MSRRALLVVSTLLLSLVAASPADAGGLPRLFGRTERSVEVKDGRTERTTKRFDRLGRMRRVAVERSSTTTGITRVTTERVRKDGTVASRAIDTTVSHPDGSRDRDLWLQAFGKDEHVALDLTIGRVGGKLAAYMLVGRGQRRVGTRSEIHWDRANMKLRYVSGRPAP